MANGKNIGINGGLPSGNTAGNALQGCVYRPIWITVTRGRPKLNQSKDLH